MYFIQIPGIMDIDGENDQISEKLSKSLSYVMFLISREGEYLNFWGNKELLYADPTDFMGKTINDIMPPEIASEQMRALKDTFELKETQKLSLELQLNEKIHHFEGELIYVNGEVAISYVKDITKIRELESQLSEKNRILEQEKKKAQNYLDFAADAIIWADAETGEIIDCNKSAGKLLERSKSEIIGMNQSELHPPHKSDYYTFQFREIVQNEGTIDKESEIITTSGEKVPVSVSASIFTTDGREIVQGIFRDISERKKHQKMLQESEKKFKTLFEQSLIPIFIVDENGDYVDANNAALEFVECDIEEIRNRNAFSFSPPKLEETQKKEHAPFYNPRLLKTEYFINGKIKTLLLNVVPFEFGGKKYLFGIGQNITDHIKAKEELMRVNELKSDLLRRTSHELKTPLVSIKGFTQLLLELHKHKFDEDIVEIIKEVQHGCMRLEFLIQDILKAAELKSGKVEIHKEPIDLIEILKEDIKEMKVLFVSREHSVKHNLPQCLKIIGESQMIKQLFQNLISNAIKYTPIKGKIHIKAYFQGDFAIIVISDEGLGFTEEEKQRIFKEFGKIERYGRGYNVNTGGTGLGLYICRKIVELHDGEIWVESEGRNRGSDFYVKLPLAK